MKSIIYMGILSFISSLFASVQDHGITIEMLSAKDLEVISSQAKIGQSVVESYLGKKEKYNENDIDATIKKWRESKDLDKESAEYLIENLGSFLGNILIEREDLIWCSWTDKRGTDLCITHKEIQITN